MRAPLSWIREFTPRRRTGRRHRRRAEPARPRGRGRRASPAREITGVVVGADPRRRCRTRRRQASRSSTSTPATGETRVVCGAPNIGRGHGRAVRAGRRARCPATSRSSGARSAGRCRDGMLCSAKELGLGDDHSGILDLDPDDRARCRRARGPRPRRRHLRPRDHAEPTRRDVHRRRRPGARRALLARRSPFRSRSPSPTPSVENDITVVVEDARCAAPAPSAGSPGVTMGESPAWMAQRLVMAGMRPISNVVDVTNYVLLERNQPLHAFDLARLRGPRHRRAARRRRARR